MSVEINQKLRTAKGKELFEVILEAELASEKEYLELADKVEDKKVKKMFKKMAKEERRHHDKVAKQFLDVIYQMEERMMPDQMDMPDFKEAPDVEKIKSDVDFKKALELALEGEKLSYSIYKQAAEKTEHKQTKKMLELMAAEEQKHYNFILEEFGK